MEDFNGVYDNSYLEDDEEIISVWPTHPGVMLKAEILEPQGITGAGLAVAINAARPSVTNMLNGKQAVTADLALRIERAINYSAETLVRMQAAYDLAAAKRYRVDNPVTVRRIMAGANGVFFAPERL